MQLTAPLGGAQWTPLGITYHTARYIPYGVSLTYGKKLLTYGKKIPAKKTPYVKDAVG